MVGVQQPLKLTQAEVQALFRLVLKRAMPSQIDDLADTEAVFLLAADLIRGYGFESPTVLTIMARMWAWIDGDERRLLMVNVIDRRYVGWSCAERYVLIDMVTGDEVSPARALPRVLESVAYNVYELLERRKAMLHGERPSLWEGKDAAAQASCSATPGCGENLGEPQVLRDDTGNPVS